MKNTISFKTQTTRSTNWHEKKAINVNLFYRNFQMGIVTSSDWGNFEIGNPKVEFEIDGKGYSMNLDNFKKLIKTNL